MRCLTNQRRWKLTVHAALMTVWLCSGSIQWMGGPVAVMDAAGQVAPIANVPLSTPAPGSNAAFRSGADEFVVRGSNGHIYLSSLRNNVYTALDLTVLTSAPPAVGDPFYGGRRPGQLHHIASIVYRGTNGHIFELWADRFLAAPGDGGNLPENAVWFAGDLTLLAGAPLAAGDPAGGQRYANDLSIMVHSVFYRGQDGHIYELYLPAYRDVSVANNWIYGNWTYGSPSVLANAPAASGTPTIYDGPAPSTQSIFYRATSGHVIELYTFGAQWVSADLTVLLGAPNAAGNLWSARLQGSANNTYISERAVVYRSVSGNVIQLRCTSAGAWSVVNVTSVTGAPVAASDPVIYQREANLAAIVYRAGDGHIYELYRSVFNNNWGSGDLTALSGAPLAVQRPIGDQRLESLQLSRNRVVFQGKAGGVHEIWLPHNGSVGWQHQLVPLTPP